MLQSQQLLHKRYCLQQQLGNNPTRQTWLADDIKSAKQVIVKLLPFSPQTQWQEIKLFEREAQVLKNLDLPRIPHYLDSFSIEKEDGGGLPWFALVQEYIPGSSLQQLLKQGRKFTEPEAKDIAKQLLKILIDLHELSPPVLHRDIKPSNIIALSHQKQGSRGAEEQRGQTYTDRESEKLPFKNQFSGKSSVREPGEQSSPHHPVSLSSRPRVSSSPRPETPRPLPASPHPRVSVSTLPRQLATSYYLVDFGAVQDRAKAEGATFTVVGTGGYSPPEQLWGKAVAASDLYALGATLVHLLTGIAPGDLPQHRMRLQFRDKATLSPEFALWLDKLLDPAVEKRFKQARQALEALQATEKVKIPEKANFRRLGGLALLQYGVVGLCALALPLFAAYRYIHEGKINVNKMNRAQQSHFLENNEFGESVEALQLGMRPQSENYSYSIRETPLYVFNHATPRKPKLKGYVGIVTLVPVESSRNVEMTTIAMTCEAIQPSLKPVAVPKLYSGNDIIRCPPGTRNLSEEYTIVEDKEW